MCIGTVCTMRRSRDLVDHIAALIRHRHEHWQDASKLCEHSGLDPQVADSVERFGVLAPLAHIHSYADALGMDASLLLSPHGSRKPAFESCEKCGKQRTHHRQMHLMALDTCVDAKIAYLLEALVDLGIRTSMSCEGDAHDDAHLVFPAIDDARAFFSIVDRGDEALRLRAGLRPLSPMDVGRKRKTRTWEHSIRWFVQPGDLLADGVCWVRFDPAEIKGLTRLMASPPKPPPIATMQRRP
jgi:hypothetical protein